MIWVLLFCFVSWLRWVSYSVKINSPCLHLSILVMHFRYLSPSGDFPKWHSLGSVHWPTQFCIEFYKLQPFFCLFKPQQKTDKQLLIRSIQLGPCYQSVFCFKTWAMLMTIGITACHKCKPLIWKVRKKNSKIQKIKLTGAMISGQHWKTERDVRDI